MREGEIKRRGRIQQAMTLAAVAAIALAMGPAAKAAILAEDDFEASALGTLQSQNQGTGWLAAWDVPITDSQVNVISAALDYLGGSIGVDGGARAVQYDGTSSGAAIPAIRQMPTTTGTVYYSFLYSTAGLTNDTPGGEFLQVGLDNTGDNPNISVVDNVISSQRQFTARNGTGGGADSGSTIYNDQTYFVVVKSELSAGTYQKNTLYVNPTNITESYNSAAAIATNNSGIDLTTAAYFMLRSARLDSGDTFIVDQVRIGTTFADVITRAEAIYSADFTGATGTQPTGFAAYTSGDIVSRNDGSANTEYEQKTGTLSGTDIAIASLADTNLIDRGSFRDVTAETRVRFSGGSSNENGMVLRSRGVTSTTSGDFYHVRIEGSDLVLYRFISGAATELTRVTSASDISSTTERLMRVTIENIADTGTDDVRIRARLYNGTTDANSVAADIDFTDISDMAITRAGGIGFRSANAAANSRSTFDDLRVYNQSPNLLFYDDYYDNQAVRMTGFNDNGMTQTVADQTYQFTSTTTSGVQKGIASVNFDAFTSEQEWANVIVTAVMNTDDNMAGGLILRETAVSNSGNGNWYTFRLNASNDLIQIGRQNNGFAVLDTFDLGDSIPLGVNIYLLFSAINVDGDVLLHAVASLNADLSNPFADMTVLDDSASKLLGPGAAGMRVFSNSAVGTVTFDNFTVTTIPEPSTLVLLALSAAGLLRRRV